MNALPTGTVTFFFSDIEGSTRLVERLGTPAWAPLLEAHSAVVRAALAANGGTEVKTEGDSFFIVFPSAEAAVETAVAIQRRLAQASWPDGAAIRVRIGIHTGEGALVTGADYVGLDVHRAARIAAAGHGGQTLLSATTATLLSQAPSGTTLRDRGEHRLKDLSRPERLVELLVEGLPSTSEPLHTLEVTPNNLPTQLTTFLGREQELTEILGLLASSRLVTLSGPGGTGKTRLSLEVASQSIERFPDGVYFIPLASIDRADLVASTIAQELGLPERGGAAPIDRLIEHLRAKQVLLVLDNFEQVVDAAAVVARILAGAPSLAVLVTSRALLRIYGEQEYPVPPLGLPDRARLDGDAEVGGFAAVRLFVERAMAVRPDFRLTDENAPAVAGICVRLDGLPLAIELAAARIRLLPPQAILTRLGSTLDLPGGGNARDLPARQQTLRGAIAWSHDLLDGRERDLFASLSVFVGGARLEAIEAVCLDEVDGDVLDGLSSLADKSLIRATDDVEGEPRFSMLETIREYAAERLAERGTVSRLRARHADVYCSLVDTARRNLMGTDKRRWLDRLEQEHGNIRSAFRWSIEQGDGGRVLRLATGMWRFWQMRGYLVEGAELVAQALATPDSHEFPDLRAAALEAAGGIEYWQGRHEAARVHYEEALALQRAMGNVTGEAEQLYNLSFTYAYGRGADAAKSLELTRRSLELFRSVDDRLGVAKALWALANGEYSAGDSAKAKEHGLEALPIFEAADDRFMVAWSEYIIAVTDFILGEPVEAAERRLRRALELFVEAGDVSGYVLVIDSLSYAAQHRGDIDRAARLAGGVAALEAASGTGLNIVNRRITGYDPLALQQHPSWQEGNRMAVSELARYALGDGVPA